MKKLILAASLALVVVAVAPVASASAAVKGTCRVHGTATFSPELSETMIEVTYNFTGHAECFNTNTNKLEEGTAVVKNGKVESTCLGKATNLVDGEGELKEGFAGGPYFFNLDITGTDHGVVNLIIEKLTPEKTDTEIEEAKGKATFFASENEKAKKCTESGVNKLEFEAVATGEIG